MPHLNLPAGKFNISLNARFKEFLHIVSHHPGLTASNVNIRYNMITPEVNAYGGRCLNVETSL